MFRASRSALRVSGFAFQTLYGTIYKLSNVDVFCLLKTKLILYRLLSATATTGFFACRAVFLSVVTRVCCVSRFGFLATLNVKL